MVCIYCGHKTQVTNSRPQKADYRTWRRRTCTSCHATVTTTEAVDLEESLRVEKRNGTYQPFLRDKLYLSIYKAVDHLDTPSNTASHLTNTVLRHILKTKPLSPVVPSSDIAHKVAAILKRFNAAASVRYLSFQTNMQLANDIRRNLK
jgi:transcriptional repressor NrdR